MHIASDYGPKQRIVSPDRRPQYHHERRTVGFGCDTGCPRSENSYELSSLGKLLVSTLQQEGIMISEDTCHLPPSFEAIHDVFSISFDRYQAIFTPSVMQQTIERIIMGTILPEMHPVLWTKYRGEIAGLLPAVVKTVGNKINEGARIDTVRLAIFLHQIAKGIPTIMENPDDDVANAEFGLRNNAVIDLAAEDTNRFILGSARVGRRLWSINHLRSTA